MTPPGAWQSNEKVDEEAEPRVRLGRILMRGSKLSEKITDLVVSGELSWAIDQVTQLSLTFVDPDFDLWERGLFERGTPMVYREPGRTDINLRVRSLALDAGPAGTGGFTVMARSELVQKLKNRRGPKVMRKASPTDFVRAEVRAAGGKVVAQKSPERKQVARDVPGKGQESAQGADKPSSWTTFGRLATELGFYLFEFGDTVYFGKPEWLVEQDKNPLYVALPLKDNAKNHPEWVARSIPSINMSEDASEPVTFSGIEVERSRFAQATPGGAMRMRGLAPFDDDYLLTALTMPLMGVDLPLTVDASTPKNPDPQPPAPPRGASVPLDFDSVGGTALEQTGSKAAGDFVAMAVSASNASYSYGAEAAVSDATPGALDCSELIQWALGRIGVPFVDGSSAQIAACVPISVADAMRTRGALLHKEGHIGISMGDGRSVEARNPADGVGIFRAADIGWTSGGLVPGLRYG